MMPRRGCEAQAPEHDVIGAGKSLSGGATCIRSEPASCGLRAPGSCAWGWGWGGVRALEELPRSAAPSSSNDWGGAAQGALRRQTQESKG